MYILEKCWRYDVLCRRKICFDPKFLKLMFILSYITYYNIHAGRERPERYISQDISTINNNSLRLAFGNKIYEGPCLGWVKDTLIKRGGHRVAEVTLSLELLYTEIADPRASTKSKLSCDPRYLALTLGRQMVKWLRFSCRLFFFHQEVKIITKYKTSSIPNPGIDQQITKGWRTGWACFCSGEKFQWLCQSPRRENHTATLEVLKKNPLTRFIV